MSLSNKDDIQVSVCVVTYNQENYIAECLESLVTQQTSFKFEIVVGEDCSTDGTRAIVQQYVEQYPDLIVPLFYEENVGAVENVKRVYKAARGKYIAHMDGDDMALPNKLQRQFDALEENLDCNICTHNMNTVSRNGKTLTDSYWSFKGGHYTVLDFLKKMPFFAHSSKFFRITEKDDWDNILCDPEVLDIEVHFYQIGRSNIIHLDEKLGKYRKNTGVSAVVDNKINSIIEERVFYVYKKSLIKYPEFNRDILRAYSEYVLNMANSYAVVEGNYNKLRELTIKSLKIKIFSFKQIGMLLLSLIPLVGVRLLKIRANIRENMK